jgi:hypothetical protein
MDRQSNGYMNRENNQKRTTYGRKNITQKTKDIKNNNNIFTDKKTQSNHIWIDECTNK